MKAVKKKGKSKGFAKQLRQGLTSIKKNMQRRLGTKSNIVPTRSISGYY